MEKDAYFEALDECLRQVSVKNLYDFNTDYRDKLKDYELKLINNQSSEFYHNLDAYISLLISHISKVREEDCINVFLAGISHGFALYRRVKGNLNKSNTEDN